MHRKIPQEIKEIYCIFKAFCIISVLFSTNVVYFIISSFFVQIIDFSLTIPYNLNTHLSRMKVNGSFGCLFYESDIIHSLTGMKVFILWTQTVLENKYVTLSGGGYRLKVIDMIHYWIWFDLFMS